MFPCFLTLDRFRVWEIGRAQSVRKPLEVQYLDLLGCEILTLVAGKFFGFKKEREEKIPLFPSNILIPKFTFWTTDKVFAESSWIPQQRASFSSRGPWGIHLKTRRLFTSEQTFGQATQDSPCAGS